MAVSDARECTKHTPEHACLDRATLAAFPVGSAIVSFLGKRLSYERAELGGDTVMTSKAGQARSQQLWTV